MKAVTTGQLLISVFFVSLSLIPAFADSTAAKSGKLTTASDVEKLLATKNVSYENHLVAARFFEAQGLLTQAAEQLHSAINYKEARPEAFKSLSQILLKTEDVKEAERVIMLGAKKFPTDYGVLLNAGFVMHNCHKLPQALDFYKRASEVRPASPDIWLAMSDVLIDLNRPKDALSSAEKALGMPNPGSLAYFEKAKALLALGRLNDAVEPLSKNFATNPFNFSSGMLYGAVLQKLGRFEESLNVRLCLLVTTSGKPMENLKAMISDLLSKLSSDAAQRSIKFAELKIGNPATRAVLHFALGDIYDHAHQPDNGMVQYKAGLSLNPDYARGYLRLGEDYEDAKSNLNDALRNYEKAYSLNAKDPEIRSRLEKLKARIKTQKK
jgi:tetratricopeptide (TPR) repeat protein